MHIDGHNNRVAGRDYYEKATLKLTPEQLAELSIKPCLRCESRLVANGSDTCNHCRREVLAEAENTKWGGYVMATLFIWGILITQSQKSGTQVDFEHLLGLGMLAAVITVVSSVMWFLLRQCWAEHGDDILKSLENWVARRFK